MTEKISDLFSKEPKKMKILLFLFIIGIILFYLSEYYFTNGNTTNASNGFDDEKYISNLESKLSNIISEINGVSDVNVMLTLENSLSYDFVSEKKKSVIAGESEQGTSVVFKEDKSGDKEPILSSVKSPKIKGVSVVCAGGNNSQIKIKIINLISSTLGLSKNRIYVTE